MSSRVVTAITAAVAGVAAGALTLLRIVLGDSTALTSLVWAEDGLFPLCARSSGVVPCLMDPWAGYFLFLPRVVAWPVSWFPLDSWPLVTNVAAALLAAALAALAVVVLRVGGAGVVASATVALLPTLAAIMSFEAIATSGSVYMLLVYVAALAICFPPRDRFPTWAFAVGFLVTALTIPSSAVLLVPLGVQVWRGRVPRKGGAVTAAAMLLGLGVQAWVAITAANPRPMSWALSSAVSWAESLPAALLTYIPGQVRIATGDDGTIAGAFASDATRGLGALGVVIGVALLVGGVALVARRGSTANGIGLLLLVGLAVGALPAAAGYANNRYFVIPVLLWSAAALLALDRWMPERREVVSAVAAAVVVAISIPALAASPTRSVPTPEWTGMLAAARAACAASPDTPVAITFTPSWPFADAQFPGPTNNVVDCSVIQ